MKENENEEDYYNCKFRICNDKFLMDWELNGKKLIDLPWCLSII
jgi:hypothetical protein